MMLSNGIINFRTSSREPQHHAYFSFQCDNAVICYCYPSDMDNLVMTCRIHEYSQNIEMS